MRPTGKTFFFICAVVLVLLSWPKQGVSQVTELTYASGWVKTHPQVGGFAEKWIARIAEATQGRVKISGIYGGSLLSPEETLPGVRKQTADLGALSVNFFPGQFKFGSALGSTIDLNVGAKIDMRGITAITLQLYDEFPQFQAEFENLGITPLVWVPSAAYVFLSTRPIEKLDDLRGKKLRGFGTDLPKLLAAAGAVPLALGIGEMYTSLQTGLIQAVITDPPNMLATKVYEVAPHLTLTGRGKGVLTDTVSIVYIGNNRSLAKLSKDDQALVRKISREMSLESAAYMTLEWEKAIKELQDKGVKTYTLPQADIEKWAAISPDWYAAAAEKLNKEGLPGSKFIERYKALAQDYMAGKWKP